MQYTHRGSSRIARTGLSLANIASSSSSWGRFAELFLSSPYELSWTLWTEKGRLVFVPIQIALDCCTVLVQPKGRRLPVLDASEKLVVLIRLSLTAVELQLWYAPKHATAQLPQSALTVGAQSRQHSGFLKNGRKNIIRPLLQHALPHV